MKIKRVIGKSLDLFRLRYPMYYNVSLLRNNWGWEFFPNLGEKDTRFLLYQIVQNSKSFLKEVEKIPKDGPVILFPHMRGGNYLLNFETFLAKRLQFEGAKPIFMACENLPQCNNRSIDLPINLNICKNCLKTNKYYSKLMRLPMYSLTDFVNIESYHEVYEVINSLSIKDCINYIYKNVPVGKLCEVSISRYLCRDAFTDNSDEGLKAWRAYICAAIVLVDVYKKAFRKLKPEIIFLCSGRFFWYSIVHWIAQKQKIRVVSYENAFNFSKRGSQWTFREEIPVSEMDLGSYWENWRNTPLNKYENNQIDQELVKHHFNPIIYPNPIENQDILLKNLNFINNNKPIVAMFPNLTWDAAVSGRRTIFKGVLEWINETIKFANRNDSFNLVIRVHPAEMLIFEGNHSREHVIDYLQDKFGNLPDNVRVIPPDSQLSSYTLLGLAKSVLVYTGTLGLESSILGKHSVIICGRAHYTNKGFGYFPQSREEYFKLLSELDGLSLPTKEEIALARRYAYMFWFRTVIPLQFFKTSKDYYIKHYTLKTLADLKPGNNPYLDLVVDGILKGKDIVLPREILKNDN